MNNAWKVTEEDGLRGCPNLRRKPYHTRPKAPTPKMARVEDSGTAVISTSYEPVLFGKLLSFTARNQIAPSPAGTVTVVASPMRNQSCLDGLVANVPTTAPSRMVSGFVVSVVSRPAKGKLFAIES